ncbi:MAG: ABC transporter substrate-binding protein [Lautropia sp.]
MASAQGSIVVTSWGGAYQEALRKALFEPFTKATGIKVIEQSPTNYAKFKAMVESGNVEWDVVDVEGDFVLRGVRDNLLEKIDYSQLGVTKDDFLPGTAHDYGVPLIVFSQVMAYDTRKIPAGKGPTSWAEFWDVKKFPGNRSLKKTPVYTLEAALLADGVPADKLYPLDIDRAFRSLDRIKPYVTAWWEAGAKPVQMLIDGEATLVFQGNARFQSIKKQGGPIDLVWAQGLQTYENWVIPRGSKRKEAALKFIAFASTAQAQADITKYYDYGPTRKESFKLLDPNAEIVTAPALQRQQILINHQYWFENFDRVNERFNQWLLR